MISPDSAIRFENFQSALFGNDKADVVFNYTGLEKCLDSDKPELKAKLIETLNVLVVDPQLNALRIAYCMTLLDSRELTAELRTSLGLEAVFSPINDFSEPRIRSAWNNLPEEKHEHAALAINCGASEEHLDRRHNRIEFAEFYRSHPQTTRPIVMYDSLLVEIVDVVTGFATQTVEFANGATLINGCWYVISTKDVRRELYRQVRHLKESDEYFIDPVSREAGVGILMAYPRHCDLKLSRVLHSEDPAISNRDGLDNLH